MVTAPAGDVTPPALTGTISITSLTPTSYTATCPAATDAGGVTGYQYRIDAGAWTTIAAAGRSIAISGRTAGATDALEMRAFDAVPNYSAALAYSVPLPLVPDTVSPTLSSPTGAATGTTTAAGTVTTSESGGVLHRLASINASESAAAVKAAALSGAVSAAGVRSVSFSGLAPETSYFAHYVHTDASGNESAVASSAAFTTAAPSGLTADPRRTWVIESESRLVIKDGLAVADKDPVATLDFWWDWQRWLTAIGDTIAICEVESDGVVVDSVELIGGKVVAVLSGGTAGTTVPVRCTITTAAFPARIDKRTLWLSIIDR